MMDISDFTDIGPVSITTDPKKFQQDLQELFVQVSAKTHGMILLYKTGTNALIRITSEYGCVKVLLFELLLQELWPHGSIT